ncbi:MAG: hypothetical protein AB9903_10620 [Vulcanimicrobiota bacterium]
MNITDQNIRKILYACLCAAALLLVLNSADAAPSPEVTASLSLDKTKATVGDIITATLEIKGPSALTVKIPEPSVFLGDLELRNAKKPLMQEREGKKSIICQFEITPFTTGKKEIGPLTVRYSLSGKSPVPEEGSSEEVKSNKVSLEVTSVLPKDGKNLDIKDIKPPMEVKYPLSYFIIGALAILLAALLIYLLVRYLLKRRQRMKEDRLSAPKTPEELAMEKLKNLRESTLLSQGKVKEFYSILSDVLREYLENRHSINAPDKTTTELYRELRESNGLAPLSAEIKSLMAQSDMVKFARAIPPEARIDEDYKEAERLFRALVPEDFREIMEKIYDTTDKKNRE